MRHAPPPKAPLVSRIALACAKMGRIISALLSILSMVVALAFANDAIQRPHLRTESLVGVGICAGVSLALGFIASKLFRTNFRRHHPAPAIVPENSAPNTNRPHSNNPESHPAEEAMRRTISDLRKSNPLIGMQVGGQDLVNKLISVSKNVLHVESELCLLGAIAGYACQASVRAEFVELKGMQESEVFTIVKGADGKKYFFGDNLNRPLAESQYSIWSLVAGKTQSLGEKDLVDLNDIFKHVAGTVGGANFGIPRIPEENKPGDTPTGYLKNLWPHVFPDIKRYCEHPSEWPIVVGIAIQKFIDLAVRDEVITPKLALSIVMESAIPMSKVDLETL